MKKFVTLALALGGIALSAPAIADSCNCLELQRRTQGLTSASTSGQVSQQDRRELQRAVNTGRQFLRQANATRDYGRREALCSTGNQQVNYEWVRWQAWLAVRGMDPGNPCG